MVPDPGFVPYAIVIPSVLGFLVLVFISAVTLFRGRRTPANRLFAVLCLLGALNNADLALINLPSDGTAALAVERLLYAAFVFVLPVYIRFVHRLLGVGGREWLERLAFAASLGLLPLTQTEWFIRGLRRYSFGVVAEAGAGFHLFSLLAFLMLFYSLLMLADGMRRSADNRERNRLTYITAGAGFCSVLIALNVLPVAGFNVYPAGGISFVPAVILAYGLLRYDLPDAGAAIRRGIVHAALVLLLAALYAAGLTLVQALTLLGARRGLLGMSFLLALLVVFLFQPLRERVQAFLDGLFFRGRYDARALIRRLSGELAGLRRSAEIREALFASLTGAIPVERLFILAREGPDGAFRARGAGGAPEPLNTLRDDHPLVQLLEAAGGPVDRSVLEEEVRGTPAEAPLTEFLADSGLELVLPLRSRDRLLGALVLGQKRSGELFVHEDLEMLGTVANQAAIAIESAAGYEEIERLNRDLERRIEERTSELTRALEEKERSRRELVRSESLAAIGQLVAGTAHEMNNPLSGASSLLESSLDELREGRVPREVVEDLEFALRELRRAAAIVRSLLSLSRRSGSRSEPVDVHAAVDDALRILHNTHKHLAVDVERRYATDLPVVEGNFASLGQVFVNIVKNALEALPGEGGTIAITTAAAGGRGDGRVSVSFRDTGVGIPAHRQEDIFKPFFTTKEVGRGTGLGLYISHEIVRGHGGEILVRSEEGRGTEVTVILPTRRST